MTGWLTEKNRDLGGSGKLSAARRALRIERDTCPSRTVFEVKQDISKAHIEYASEKAKSVRTLHRTSALKTDYTGQCRRKETFDIPAGILTLSSSWTPGLDAPFREAIENAWATPNEELQLGCVLSAGAFRVARGTETVSIETSPPEASLMYFLMSLFKTLQPLGTVPAVEMDEYLKWIES